MSIESVMPSNHLILSRPLLPPSVFPSIRVFSNESVLFIRWPKYWSFSFNISPSMNIQKWFPLGLTGLISLQSKGLSRVFSYTTVQKHHFFGTQLSLWSNSHIHTFSSVQLLSRVQLLMTPWTAARQASLPSPPPRAYSISCPSSQWCHPTISSSVIPFSSHLQSFPASGSFPVSQFFTSGGQSIKSFSVSISPSNEYSGLISLRMDWLDLLAVQGTLKSLLQHHSSKASILWHSAFFIVQLSHPYMITGKTIALTRRTFVGHK